jgi:hypothetical protein
VNTDGGPGQGSCDGANADSEAEYGRQVSFICNHLLLFTPWLLLSVNSFSLLREYLTDVLKFLYTELFQLVYFY